MSSGSVLETFFLLFDSNADKVKQGNQQAEQSSQDLEHSLNRTDAAGVAMGEHLISTLKEVAAGFIAAFSIQQIGATITETAELNAQLGITAERLGLAVEDVDAWSRAAKAAGGDAGGFVQTLDFLNRGLADIATKGTSRLKPFFDELKIKTTDAPHHVRPILDVLGDLADRFKTLGAQQSAGIAEKLGIDPGAVLLLRQGRDGVAELVREQKALGVITAEDTERAHKFKVAQEELETRWHMMATALGSSVLPKLTEFFGWIGRITDYLAGHKGLVEGFFIGVAGIVATVYTPAIVTAASATWALLAPILAVVVPILAVGTAIALLVDDVQNFLAGNQSVIGELSKRWPVIGEVVRETVKLMGEAFSWVGDVISGLVDLWEGQWDAIASITVLAISKIVGAFNWVSDEIKEVGAAFGKIPFWGEFFKALGGAMEWFIGIAEKAFGWLVKFAEAAVHLFPKALHNAAADLHGIAGVAQGKETYAQYEDRQRVALVRRLQGQPEPGAPVAVDAAHPSPRPSYAPGRGFSNEVKEGVLAAQAHIQIADTSPISSLTYAVNSNRGGDRHYSFTVQNMNIQAPSGDPGEFAKAARAHLEDEMRQAIGHFDDGVAG